jgi:hypothetical protein
LLAHGGAPTLGWLTINYNAISNGRVRALTRRLQWRRPALQEILTDKSGQTLGPALCETVLRRCLRTYVDTNDLNSSHLAE